METLEVVTLFFEVVSEFERRVESKTGWGKNEIKVVLAESIQHVLKKASEKKANPAG